MQSSIYDYVMAKLGTSEESLRKIAAATGIPYSTLTRIARGDTKDPSVHDFDRLYQYFQQLESPPAPKQREPRQRHSGAV